MAYTFILSRQPAEFFTHGGRSGRWGELVAIKGPKISAVALKAPVNANKEAATAPTIQMKAGVVELSTASDEPISKTLQYTTMERYFFNGVDKGKGFYVQLRPRTRNPYRLRFEATNSVVKTLRPKDDTFHGNCIRVLGGDTAAERGILIHEAPKTKARRRSHLVGGTTK